MAAISQRASQKPDPLLEHPVRLGILQALETWPGLTVTVLSRVTNTKAGRVEFHLHRLRRCGWVSAHRLDEQIYWFREPVARHERESAAKRLLVHPATATGRAFGFLMETNGSCTSTLARALGWSPGHAHRHLSKLAEAGWIAPRSHGRRTRWYVALDGRVCKPSAVRDHIAGCVKTTPEPL